MTANEYATKRKEAIEAVEKAQRELQYIKDQQPIFVNSSGHQVVTSIEGKLIIEGKAVYQPEEALRLSEWLVATFAKS